MSRGGWALLVGSGLLAAIVVATVTRESAKSPEVELREVQERMKRGHIDREEALSDLNHLVDRTTSSGDSRISARTRLARARILMEIGAVGRAREDLQIVLGLGVLSPEERRDVEDDLIDLDLRSDDRKDLEHGLQRVKDQIDRNPDDGAAWARKGALHLAMAEATLARGREVVDGRLLADAAERGRAILDRLGAMDPADPRRAAVGRELSVAFGGGDERSCALALRAADAAAQDSEQARIALATSLSDLGARPGPGSALASLLGLLDRAGRSQEASRLGVAVWRRIQALGDVDAAMALARIRDRLGNGALAGDVAKWIVGRGDPISSARLAELCDIFYRAERWVDLGAAAARLGQTGNASELVKSRVYGGIAGVKTGESVNARFALTKFSRGDDPEPFRGARAEAWRALAEIAKRQHKPDEEIDALESAIELEPEKSGPSLLRLAELQFESAHGGYRGPEERHARAMNLMPERTEELLLGWKKMGVQELRAEGLSRDGVLTDTNWRRVLNSPATASPYELYVAADVLTAAGQPGRAEPCARKLVETLPGFVPGFDLLLRVEIALSRDSEVLDTLLARIRLAGADTKVRAILSRIPTASIRKEQRLELMRFDPEGFGRREFARGFLAQGRPDLALTLVGDATGPNGLLDARLVAAQAALDLNQPEKAFDLLDPLGRHVSSRADGFDLYARAAALSGHREELERATTRASGSILPAKRTWLALCDTLLALGEPRAAMPLIKRMDSGRRTLQGDVLVRKAWAELLLGDAVALKRTLLRAPAFETHGQAELIALLACSRSPSWDGLQDAARALRASSFRPSPIQDAALSALEGKPKAARKAVDAAFDGGRKLDPLWIVADAATAKASGAELHDVPTTYGDGIDEETRRFLSDDPKEDPRRVWSVILALDQPAAAGWVQSQVVSTGMPEAQREPGLFASWILAHLARSLDQPAAERRLLEDLLFRWPDFGPAWDRLDEIARAMHASSEELDDLRERRLHGLGARAGTRAEIELEIARIQRRKLDLDGALATATSALEKDLASSEIRGELGRIRAARGEWKEAVSLLVRASRIETPRSDSPITGDLIHALEGAGLGPEPSLPAETRLSELEALETRVPDDPRVPVALARMDLEMDPRNPTIAVGRAFARLDGFREAHRGTSFEKLCEGSLEAWTDFLIPLDPERARAILKEERTAEPTNLEPWLQMARIDAADARTENPTLELDRVLRMCPIPRVVREHALDHLANDPTAPEIANLTSAVRKAEGTKEPDPEVSLRIAEALFDLGPRGTRTALDIAKRLAAAPSLEEDLSNAVILLRGHVLVALDRPGDASQARKILHRLQPRLRDPYAKTAALACERLAVGMARDAAE
jgi:tetratricopeptide (TPR) repeat protein